MVRNDVSVHDVGVIAADLKVVTDQCTEFKLKALNGGFAHVTDNYLEGCVAKLRAEGPEFVGGVDYLNLLIIHRHIVVDGVEHDPAICKLGLEPELYVFQRVRVVNQRVRTTTIGITSTAVDTTNSESFGVDAVYHDVV